MSENLIPLPIYLLTPQPHRTGDYLKTLHEWGELPEVVTVPNVARLLAVLCKQNPAAIVKVLGSAIDAEQIKYWSWAAPPSGGTWREDEPTFTIRDGAASLHLGSMGIRPADAVGLLVTRGRKVPPELLELLPVPAIAAPVPVVVDVVALGGEAWINKARDRAAEIIKRQREKDLYPSQENLGDEIAREFRAAGIVGADGKPLSGAYIKRHALKGISSAQGKQLSTQTGRGKQGK